MSVSLILHTDSAFLLRYEINNTVSIHAQTVASALQHFERLKQPIAWNISQIDAANKSPENSTISTTLE
jgi:hypothetical protein